MLNVIARIFIVGWAAIFLALNSLAYEFNDDNLALLDVVYQRQSVGNGLDVYLNDDSFYIPLVDLVALLELAVNVQEDSATGTLYGNETIFALEKIIDQWRVTLDGQQLSIPPDAIVMHEDLIYIDNAMAAEWFGAKFELDFSDSNVLLSISRPLPFADRIARNTRSVNSQFDIGPAVLPEWKQPYKWAEVPSIDARLNYFSTRYEDKKIKKRQLSTTHYAVRTVGDFAAMSTETFLSGTRENGLAGATVRMDRYDHNREILGPLGFSQVSIGDITNPAQGFTNSAFGRGILVGNDISEGGSSRDVRDIEGDYYPGWDVELYLNNAIIGYQTIDDTGHYAFKDVILFSGNNDFKLKFYGPTGQVVEQARRIVVGDDVVDLRKLRYSIAITQPNKQVIKINNDQVDTVSDDAYQVGFSSRYLLAKQLGISFGVQEATHQTAAEKEEVDPNLGVEPKETPEPEYQAFRYYSLGLQSYFGGISLSLNSTAEENGAVQYGANLGGVLWGTLYQVRVSQYDKKMAFGGKVYSELDNPIYNSYDLSLNKRVGSHSFIVRGSTSRYKVGSNEDARFGYSGQFGFLGFSTALEYAKKNTLNISDDSNPLEVSILEPEYLAGATFLSASQRSMSVRLSGAYTIRPKNELNTVSLSTAWRVDDDTNLEASINYNVLSDTTYYRLGLNWNLPQVRITPGIAYSDVGFWQGQVQVSASLGNRTGRIGNYYRLGSDPTLTQGAVRARLFEDANRDGSYQLGEELLSGGEIQALQARRQGRSNKGGVAWIESMPSWGLTDIKINENSIDAGYMALQRDDFSIMSRPGRTVELDLPFTRVGEIDGTVVMMDGEFVTEARGVTVLLKDSVGKVVAEHSTDSQGYFNFTRVKPDDYSFDVKDHVLLTSNPSRVTIDNTGNYEPGIALTIKMPVIDTDINGFPDAPVTPPSSDIKNTPVKAPVIEYAPDALPADDAANEVKDINHLNNLMESTEILPSPNAASALSPVVPMLSGTPVVNVVTALTPAPESSQTNTPNKAPAPVVMTQPTVTAQPTVNVGPQGEWALQAGSFSSDLMANRFVEKVKEVGLSAVVQPAIVNGASYFRVFVGAYRSRAEALVAKAKIDAALNVSSVAAKPAINTEGQFLGQL